MKIIITGGAGFIGSSIVDRLIINGNQVLVLDNLSSGKLENINTSAEFVILIFVIQVLRMYFSIFVQTQ